MNQHWTVGDIEITCVTEVAFDVPAEVLVRDFDAAALTDELQWLQPDYLTDGMLLRIAIQTFAVRAGSYRLLVDTCFGNDHDLPYFSGLRTNHLDALTDAGFAPDDVDAVVCTHLHMDHVGWNTRLVDGEWVPTFPRAEYLFSSREYEHWQARLQFDAGLAESIDPIIAAGLHRFVDVSAADDAAGRIDHEITPGVRLISTPGHTPGHVSVRIDSGGDSALIGGDMIHHPVQVIRHDWASVPDHDPVVSVATRRRMYGELAAEGALVLGTHFMPPTGGRIAADGDGWSWRPMR